MAPAASVGDTTFFFFFLVGPLAAVSKQVPSRGEKHTQAAMASSGSSSPRAAFRSRKFLWANQRRAFARCPGSIRTEGSIPYNGRFMPH